MKNNENKNNEQEYQFDLEMYLGETHKMLDLCLKMEKSVLDNQNDINSWGKIYCDAETIYECMLNKGILNEFKKNFELVYDDGLRVANYDAPYWAYDFFVY